MFHAVEENQGRRENLEIEVEDVIGCNVMKERGREKRCNRNVNELKRK